MDFNYLKKEIKSLPPFLQIPFIFWFMKKFRKEFLDNGKDLFTK